MAAQEDNVYVLKLLISNLVSIILTGVLAWFSFGGDQFVTERRVRQMIATEAPYIQDRAVFIDMRDDLNQINTRLRSLETDVAKLSTR